MPACCMPCLARWLPLTQFIERNVARLAFCAKGTPCVFYSRALFCPKIIVWAHPNVQILEAQRERPLAGKNWTVVSLGASSLSISGVRYQPEQLPVGLLG